MIRQVNTLPPTLRAASHPMAIEPTWCIAVPHKVRGCPIELRIQIEREHDHTKATEGYITKPHSAMTMYISTALHCGRSSKKLALWSCVCNMQPRTQRLKKLQKEPSEIFNDDNIAHPAPISAAIISSLHSSHCGSLLLATCVS